MKIKLFNDYCLTPFDLAKQYKIYAKVLEANSKELHAVEMDHIAFYEKNQLFDWFKKVEDDGLLNYLICDKDEIIGRISIYYVEYDNQQYASLSIFLDKKYYGLNIMSSALKAFLILCEQLHIKHIMWEAKSINEVSNHLAQKLGFVYWKQVKINPKLKNPNWNCEFYNLYLKK